MSKATNSSIHVLGAKNGSEAQVKAGPSPEELIQKAAIARLRASKQKDAQYTASRGETDGRRWAQLDASHSDLVLISKFNPDYDGSDLKYRMWMVDYVLEGRDDENYLRGFLKGAQGVFREVKDLI